VWGRRYRPRLPENVIKELLWLKNIYGIEEVMMEDDNLTLEPKRAEKIFDLMIRKKLNMVWDTPNGVAAWTLNEKLVKKMIKSGCYSINLAIESGNQYHLTHNIRKPVNLEKVKEIVRIIKQYDVHVMVYIVFGVPGETRQTMFDTYKYIAQLGLGPEKMFISIATPYFGTDLYEICKKRNYLKREVTPSAFHIRSYWIETENLSSLDIKIIMRIGAIYLIYQKAKHQEHQSIPGQMMVAILSGIETSLVTIFHFYKRNQRKKEAITKQVVPPLIES
jgi:magnesium-protoporphyrin IX monomethyl ester (oxidative) cyclase